ncbi:MAG: ectoine synthase, partial [Pseudomonadota bacterium]
MIYRHVNELADTNRVVSGPNYSSRRLIRRDDRMGYSLHDTI